MLHVLANLISVKWSSRTLARASVRARDSAALTRSRLTLRLRHSAQRCRNYKMHESEVLLVRRDTQIQQLATSDTQDWAIGDDHPNATWTLVLRKPGLFSLFFLSPRWTICLAIAAPHSTKRRPIRINCITVVFFEIADGWPWLNSWILCDISVITKDSIFFFFYFLYEFSLYLHCTKWCFALLCGQTNISDS